MTKLAAILFRVIVGMIFLIYGLKDVGSFGGNGFTENQLFYLKFYGIPTWFTAFTILVRCILGTSLILGVFSKISAAGLLISMIHKVYVEYLKLGNYELSVIMESLEYIFLPALLISSLLLIIAGFNTNTPIKGKKRG